MLCVRARDGSTSGRWFSQVSRVLSSLTLVTVPSRHGWLQARPSGKIGTGWVAGGSGKLADEFTTGPSVSPACGAGVALLLRAMGLPLCLRGLSPYHDRQCAEGRQ